MECWWSAWATKGLELIVGARNDQDWGPVLLVGSGGVLAEAIEDVRILAADLATRSVSRSIAWATLRRVAARLSRHTGARRGGGGRGVVSAGSAGTSES